MDFQAIADHLSVAKVPGLLSVELPRSPDKKIKDKGRSGLPYVCLDPSCIVEFLMFCRDDEALGFEVLVDLTASDPSSDDENLWILVQLLSVRHRHRLGIKCILPKSALSMPSSTKVYRAAQWHERECMEMYGVTFEDHPDPRNMLLPDDWVGYPMRKDYVFPKEYHGISCE
ncbi:MAG: NADH-quinone oxidoreductase subunit C [Planctomycetota bacterium]|jgi:NADH-quinone oxidoreductase subunit C|nr:NADH-quinone oxidoreductase subunit C [Planctomycetota bacterium]